MDGTCEACGKQTFFIQEAIYEGFTKVGERLKCANCGALSEGSVKAAMPATPKPSLFSEADRGPAIHLFEEGENRQLCRYCAHYVLNPFTQRCGLHDREIEATDTCPDFAEPKEGDEKDDGCC